MAVHFRWWRNGPTSDRIGGVFGALVSLGMVTAAGWELAGQVDRWATYQPAARNASTGDRQVTA